MDVGKSAIGTSGQLWVFEKNHILKLVKFGISLMGRGEWPSGLRCCDRIGKFTIQTLPGARLGLGIQPRYEAPSDLRVETK